jgi:hypothetical protein
MYPPGNSRRIIRLDLVPSMRSPVPEMGVASAAELDKLDAAAPGAFRRDPARSLNNLAYRLAGQGRQDEALAAAEESTRIRRELAMGCPGAPAAANRPARRHGVRQLPGADRSRRGPR